MKVKLIFPPNNRWTMFEGTSKQTARQNYPTILVNRTLNRVINP